MPFRSRSRRDPSPDHQGNKNWQGYRKTASPYPNDGQLDTHRSVDIQELNPGG